MKKVIIIGAGLAGAIAAKKLKEAGFEVQILEKSRGAGGRMATKRMTNARADHGAQYFSAKTAEFKSQVEEWKSSGLITAWKRDSNDHYQRFFCSKGMSELVKDLFKEISIITEKRALSWLEKDEKIFVKCSNDEIFEADYLICTAPSPQAIELMENSNSEDTDCKKVLNNIQYQPCIALLVKTKEKVDLGNSFSEKYEEGSNLSWIMDNNSKGFSVETSYTIHSSHEFAIQNFEESIEKLAQDLLAAIPQKMIDSGIQEVILHKWRYSIAVNRNQEAYCKSGDTIYFGGDGFGMGNVEGAYLSGSAIAQDLISNI